MEFKMDPNIFKVKQKTYRLSKLNWRQSEIKEQGEVKEE